MIEHRCDQSVRVGAQGRQRVRPEVGALQPVVCRAAGHEVALGADVDLLAPVDAALGDSPPVRV